MKAMTIDSYGGSDRLKLDDMPDPVPAADEIVLRVRAAGVNPVDWKIRQGQLWPLVRLHFPYIPGADVAGEVLRVGKPGDQVQTGRPGDRLRRCDARRRLCRIGGGPRNLPPH